MEDHETVTDEVPPVRVQATAEGPALITPTHWEWLNDDHGHPLLLDSEKLPTWLTTRPS